MLLHFLSRRENFIRSGSGEMIFCRCALLTSQESPGGRVQSSPDVVMRSNDGYTYRAMGEVIGTKRGVSIRRHEF